ncbi:MAG TPA: prolyl oligopeptidase family serine peptidase [Gemmatirosa sp.]
MRSDHRRAARGGAIALAAVAGLAATAAAQPAAGGFTLAQLKAYPFPTELTAATTGARLAWALDERGRRNVWAAEGPDFVPRQLTRYTADDGQELTSVSLSSDGRYVVYVRGGEHGANWADAPPNPASSPVAPVQQLWAVPFTGGAPHVIADGGDDPAIAPHGDRLAFIKDHQVWTAPLDGSAPARRLLAARGEASDLQWSPDGSRLAFVSGRGDHAFVGVFTSDSAPIVWLAPSTARDGSPQWSPDGRRITFVRRAPFIGPADSLLVRRATPWAIWTADATSGAGQQLWHGPETLRGSVPTTDGGPNLNWAAGGRVVFLANLDGWPHLYSVRDDARDAGGQAPLLLTPGHYMAEHVRLSPDRRTLVFSANMGTTPGDVDRRHVVRVPVDRAAPEVVTPGTGLEWTPVFTGDGQTLAFVGATAQRPPLPMMITANATAPTPRVLGAAELPADFPAARLVVPTPVVYRAPDGVEVHAQLFVPAGDAPAGGRRPAVVFVHGGPPRQMLLGWHYSDYYSNTYALNQYLASRGYIVLSVNYRLGIGYGVEFQRPANAGAQGAAEYQDVQAAAAYLRARPDVDPARVGIYGGSYGGFLTAMALARNSNLFAAGVDIHGVHDWTAERVLGTGPLARDRYEQAPDAGRALAVAWRSSPVASMATWRSPVLLIHGDDDRNVRFAQTVDLSRRLAAARVPFDELVLPDETHHLLRHANQVAVDSATAAFFDRTIGHERATRAAAR